MSTTAAHVRLPRHRSDRYYATRTLVRILATLVAAGVLVLGVLGGMALLGSMGLHGDVPNPVQHVQRPSDVPTYDI